MNPQDQDFSTLVRIVADVFRVTPEDIMGACKLGPISEARHLVGAIWSETHTLIETARRLNRGNHWTIQHSRKRVERMLLDKPGFDMMARDVVRRLAEEAPQILRNYGESEPTKKMQERDEFSCEAVGAA